MDAKLLLLVLVVAAAGACIQAALGFGGVMVTMAFLPLFMDYGKAMGLSIFIFTISTLVISVKYRQYIRWKIMLPFLIPTLVICGIVNVLSASVTSTVMYLLLGIMFVAVAVYFFVFSERIRITPNKKTALILGGICGICYGLFGIGGPTSAMYFIPSVNNKKEYLGTIQAFLCFNNVLVVIISLILGRLTLADVPVMGVGAAALLIGTVLGLYIFKKLPAKGFSRIIYAFVGISGIWMIVSHVL